MFALNLRRAALLALITFVPAACATNGAGSVTPPTGTRAIEAKGGAGGGGGGGPTAPAPTPTPNVCQPLPGTCVLTAQMLPPGSNTSIGQIRFERSPQRMAVTTTINVPGAGPPPLIAAERFNIHIEYTGVLVNPYTVFEPAVGGQAYRGYAARGLFDANGNLVLESLPGDGLYSHTPNFLPQDPSILARLAAYFNFVDSDPATRAIDTANAAAHPAYPTILTPPTADVVAAFENVHAGSPVDLVTVVEQAQPLTGLLPATTTFVGARGVFQ